MITLKEGGGFTLTMSFSAEELCCYQHALLHGARTLVHSDFEYGNNHPVDWVFNILEAFRLPEDLLMELRNRHSPQTVAA